jgi:hypothetical protein
LRQLRGGLELRGYTRPPLEWSWDTNSCLPRAVGRWLKSSAPPSQGTPPADFVRHDRRGAERAASYARSGKTLYEAVVTERNVECRPLRFEEGDLVRETRGPGKKRRIERYSTSFAEGGSFELSGPAVDELDEQGQVLESVAIGCMSFRQWVRETSDALELLPLYAAEAYHPDDVSRWYKTEAACLAEVARRPRVRLERGRTSVAGSRALRLLGGC